MSDILQWVWARHHNVLSWYIRPLFLIPFCYFACRRSFLKMEQEYLTGAWDLRKIAPSMIIPACFISLGFTFWKHWW